MNGAGCFATDERHPGREGLRPIGDWVPGTRPPAFAAAGIAALLPLCCEALHVLDGHHGHSRN